MDYRDFARSIESLTGVDLCSYKEKQMKRRIDTLIQRLRMEGYDDYLSLLSRDANALNYFVGYITINVTEFFRNPAHWHRMEQDVLPYLSHPQVWSMACSTGQEPYSLAMSLAERHPLNEIKILATDIDEKVLEYARRGIYTENEMGNVSQRLRNKYFTKEGSSYRVCDKLRRRIEFRKMDLLKDRYPGNLDLIVCRNVLIYFTEEAKNRIYEKLHDALSPQGFLFTGNAEQIIYYKKIGLEKICNYLYRPQQNTFPFSLGDF